jgi:hypothetical protein
MWDIPGKNGETKREHFENWEETNDGRASESEKELRWERAAQQKEEETRRKELDDQKRYQTVKNSSEFARCCLFMVIK